MSVTGQQNRRSLSDAFIQARRIVEKAMQANPLMMHVGTVARGKQIRTRSSANVDNCSICIESMDTCNESNSIKCLPCFHKFHTGCIDTWLNVQENRSCPVCRLRIEN
ncbi:hypothetical protein DPMN_056132 [Dreissena polymorpha]|uniref:RING-type domain-containing protein n=2 Tax=Dreissena polymorpha TaxID=45954 RepID=A0A9D4HT79_DREPO|nr:hypothetical protein DPMN_056132 [Dreissena polymorpha]